MPREESKLDRKNKLGVKNEKKKKKVPIFSESLKQICVNIP